MENLTKYDLTSQQKSLYNIEKVYTNSKINNIAFWLEIDAIIDFKILNKAINCIVEKNDNYRLQFVEENGEVKQFVREYKEEQFEILEVNNINEVEENIKGIKFNVTKDNLCIFKLFKYPNNKGGIITCAHHLVGDAWTMSIFINQIMEFYNKLLNDEDISEIKYPSYIDYVKKQKEYENTEKYNNDKIYWKEKLNTQFDKLSLKDGSTTNNSIRVEFDIDSKLLFNIREFCNENKISEYVFFLSIYCIYFGKMKGYDKFVIGNPILNRSNFAEKNTSGLFMSTLPFLVEIKNEMDFLEYTKFISTEQMSMYKHLKYPDFKIIEDYNRENSTKGNLYDIVFSYQNAKANKKLMQTNIKSRWVETDQQLNSLMIHFKDTDDTGKPLLIYDYLKDVFSQEDIQMLNERIMSICKQAIENKKVEDFEIVSDVEKDILINKYNDTYLDYDRNSTIVSNLQKVVENKKDEIALVYNNYNITYDELNKQANKLARYLQKKGINKNDIVPVIDSRSIDMIIAMLAIMKIGCTYVPIDVEYPSERIKTIIDDINAKIILTRQEYKDKLDNSITKVFVDLKEYNNEDDKNLELDIDSNSLAYLIYTSGTTGKPKGVMITHKNVINFIEGTSKIIDFNNKTIVSVTTISFDIFVLESWLSLIKGAKIVIANNKEQNISYYLNKLCLENNVQMIQTTPSRMKALMNDTENIQFIENMTDIMVGGEGVPLKVVNDIKDITTAKIFNMYGPTETTVWSTIKELTNENKITIGKPISNTSIYILNKDKKICPIGVEGNLYIGGDGVGKGYYNNEKLTSEKFIINPYNRNEIIYDTGDIAKWNNDENLVCLGRNDFQVKINGHRIEIEEIENVILKYEGIEDVAVVTKDNTSLIAVYTSNEEKDYLQIRNFILEKLPLYMVPNQFIRIDKMPKTNNGKLDRKTVLKNLNEKINIIDEVYEEPSNNIEKILFDTFYKVTGEKININKDFFSYGLDSLNIIKVQTLLLKNSWNINLQDFYKYPTIKELANKISNDLSDNEELVENEEVPTIKEDINNIVISGNKNNYKDILLTGSTGFIGIHILEELILNTKANIHCIIRSKKNIDPNIRLKEKIDFYFNGRYKDLIGKRIFIYEGDITNSIDDIMKINNIDCVIHSAAIVKHYGDEKLFKRVNIEGTKNIIELCKKYNCTLCYFSSLSVSGNYLVRQDNRNKEFTEDSLYIGQNYKNNIYVYTKFESEKLIYKAIQEGLKATVYRIGIVSGRYEDGIMQDNIEENAFYERIKTIANLQKISDNMYNQEIEFTPVDLLAKAIVKLIDIPESLNKIYHLYNSEMYTIKDIINCLKLININIDIVSKLEFEKFLKDISQDTYENDKIKGIINDINNEDNKIELNYDFTVNIKSEKTKKYLKLLGFEWPKTKLEKEIYLNKIFRYMKKIKYI